MAVGLLVLVYRQARPARHRRIAAWCAAILTAAAGGWSRVYLVSEGGSARPRLACRNRATTKAATWLVANVTLRGKLGQARW
jgi:hypothetical protein